MKEKMNSTKIKTMKLYARTSGILADNRGEGYIDTVVVILISLLGVLLLAGLYALFGDVELPKLTRRIQEMFNYAG